MKKKSFFIFLYLLVFSFFTEKAYSGNPGSGIKGTPQITVASGGLTITPPVGSTTLFCTGVPYQFGAVDTTAGSINFYSWYCYPSTGVIITGGSGPLSNGPNYTFPTVGTYTLSLVVQTNSGIDSARYAISVAQTPTLSILPQYPIVCQGGSGDTLHVSGAGVSGTYTWSPASDIVAVYSPGDSILINPLNTGPHSYTVIGTSAAGCPSAPVVVTATVSPPPVINAYAAASSICSYANTSVHMDPSYYVAGTTYTWTSGPNGNLGTPFSQSSAVSPIYSGNVDTTFTYYGNVTVPGCPAAAFPQYTVNVTVVPSPTVYVASDTVDNCNKKGDSLKVTGNPSTGVTFNWTPAYGLSSTTGSSIYANPSYSVTYYVTPSIVLSNMTCIGRKDSIKVLIGDSTNASITPLYHIMCSNDTNMLIAGPALAQLNGSYKYTWAPSTNPPIIGASVANDTIYISPNSTTIFTLTVTGTCVKKHTAELTIGVNTNCHVPNNFGYTVTSDTICTKHCVYYTDLTQSFYGEQKPLFYMWVFSGISSVVPQSGSASCPRCSVVVQSNAVYVYYAATDSLPVPKVKVCYNVSSWGNANNLFPVDEYIWYGVPRGTNFVHATGTIVVDGGPQAVAGHNVTINLGDNTTLNALGSSGTSSGIANYTWSPPTALSCTNCPNPVANPSVTTAYILTAVDNNGCTDTSIVTVFVDLKCFDPFIPNAFSPNGDKFNDVLYVHSNCLSNFTFKIFDRWGEKVFETADINSGWDGTFRNEPLNAGVFIYTFDGYLSTGKEVKLHGNITLVK